MAITNWDSILKQVKNFTKSIENTSGYKNAVAMAVNARGGVGGGNPKEAADAFVQVLSREIMSSGLGYRAKSAITDIGCTEPTAKSNGTYSVGVYFNGEMHRDSLDPQRYPGGIDNIAALLNNGVDHTMKRVYGVWHRPNAGYTDPADFSGEEIGSRTVIPGAQFVESAIRSFMHGGQQKYGVINIMCAWSQNMVEMN